MNREAHLSGRWSTGPQLQQCCYWPWSRGTYYLVSYCSRITAEWKTIVTWVLSLRSVWCGDVVSFLGTIYLPPSIFISQYTFKGFPLPSGSIQYSPSFKSHLIQEYACKIFQDLQQNSQVSLDNFQRRRTNLASKLQFLSSSTHSIKAF